MFGCSNQSWNVARVGPSGKGSGKRKEVKPKPQSVSAVPPLSTRTTPQVKRSTTCSSSVNTGNTGATGGTERLSAFDIVECSYLIGLEEGRFSPSFEEDFSSDSTVSADRGSLSNKDDTNTGDTSMAIGPTQREFSNSTEIGLSSETVPDTHGSLFSQRCFAAGDAKDQASHSGTSNRLEERNASPSEKDLSSTSTYSATHPHAQSHSHNENHLRVGDSRAQASTSNISAKESPTESASPSGSISHSGRQEDDSSGPSRVLDSNQQLNQVYRGSKNVTSACIVQGLKEGSYSLAAMGVYKGVVTACVDIDESSDEELIPIEEIKDDDEEDVVMQCSQNQDPCIDLTDEKDCINISSEEESDPQCLFSNIQTATRPLQSCTSQSHLLPSTLEYPPSAPCEANQLPDQAYSSPNPTDHLLVQPHCQPSPPDHPSKLSCLLPFSSQHLQDQPYSPSSPTHPSSGLPYSQPSPTQHPSCLSNPPPHTSQHLQDQPYSPSSPTHPSLGLPYSKPSPTQHPSSLSNPPPHTSQYLQDQAYSPTSPTHPSPGLPYSQPSPTQHPSCLSNPPPHSSQYLPDQPYSPSSPTHPSPGRPHSQPPCSSHNHPNPSNPPVSSARSQTYSTSSSWRYSHSAFSPLWPSPSPVCSPRSPSPSVSSPKPYSTSSSLRYSHSACSPLWPSPSPLYSPRTPSPSLSSPSPAFSPLSISQHTPSPLQQSPSPAYSPLSPPKEPLRPRSSSLSISQHTPSPQHESPSPAYSPLSPTKQPLRLRSLPLSIFQHTSSPQHESPSPAFSPLSPPKEPLRLCPSSLSISQYTSSSLQESPSPAFSPLSPPKEPLRLRSSRLSSEGNLPISLCSGPSQRSPLYPPSSTLQPSPSLVFLSPSLSRPSPCVSKNPLGLGMLYRPPHLLQQSSSVPFSLLSHPPQHQADMKGDKTLRRAEVSHEENEFDRRHGHKEVGNLDNTPARAQLPMPQILYTTNPVLQVSPRVHTMTWENQSEQEKRDIKNRFLTTEVKNYLSQFGDLQQVLRALDKPPVSLDEWKRLKSTCEANDLEMEKLHLQQLAMKQDLLEHGWSEEKQESHQAAKEKMWLLKLKKEMLSFERDSVLAHHFCKPGHPVPADLLLEAEHGQISSMEGVPLILKVSIPKRSYVVLRTIRHFIETIEKHLTGAPDSLKAMLHGDRKTILRSLTYHGNYRDTSVMLGKRIAWYKEVQVKLRQLPPPQTLQEDFIKERLATLRRATDTIRHCKVGTGFNEIL